MGPALKILKWLGIALGGLVGVLVIAIVVIYFIAGSRLDRTFEIDVAPIAIPADDASIERGRHLAVSVGLCTECHESDLRGQVMEDDALFGRLVAKNLTTGKGGIGGSRTDLELVAAIRHGIDPDGKPLIVMPSSFYNKLSDTDIGAIIAYIRSVPPVDNEVPSTAMGPLGRLFVLMAGDDLLTAQAIDHTAPSAAMPEQGVTVEYGQYLAVACSACHGDNLGGGTGESGPAPNITPSGAIGKWTEEQFIRTLRLGVTPDQRKLDPENMPWKSFGQMTDPELKAVWLYLQSIPPSSEE